MKLIVFVASELSSILAPDAVMGGVSNAIVSATNGKRENNTEECSFGFDVGDGCHRSVWTFYLGILGDGDGSEIITGLDEVRVVLLKQAITGVGHCDS